MKFYSTNQKAPHGSFQEALFHGQAPDGGLYMPTTFPQFSKQELETLPMRTLPQIGALVLQKWLGDEIPSEELDRIADSALSFPIPLVTVGEKHILELFHGPTQAFKDVAAQILPRLFEYFLQKNDQHMTVLVATSGDTGGAVAQGFSGLEHVRVVILYPKGKVSMLQEEQLTRGGKNVASLAIAGNFDDCQSYVKQAFADPDLAHLLLSSANSINIGRLLPQIIYYVWLYAKLPDQQIEITVPSGNMGNITAGLFAQKMGIPFPSFILATNKNDSAVVYYETGKFSAKPTLPTLSSAMDIGNPSNFIRILDLFGYDHTAFCEQVKAVRITEEETIATMKHVYQKYGYLLDPHTAVGWSASEKMGNASLCQVVLSTASAIKFAAEIENVTHIHIDDKAEIKKIQQKQKQVLAVENSYKAVKEALYSVTS